MSRQAKEDQTSHSSGSLGSGTSITELIARYRRFAESYYVRAGQPTQVLACMRYALRPVRHLYGSVPAREFGPLALKAVQQYLVDEGLCRTHINARINRVKRFFKWAVSEELVESSVYESLRTVLAFDLGERPRGKRILFGRSQTMSSTRHCRSYRLRLPQWCNCSD
jgi:hypothetical protein